MTAHIALCFVVGGAFVACCALAAEALGTEVGGIVAGLPSTVVVTLLFVAATDSPQQAVRETTFIPVALALNCLFFAVYGRAGSRGALPAMAAALATWLVLAGVAVLFGADSLGASLSILAVGFAVGFGLLRGAAVPPAPGDRVRTGPLQMLARAVFGGTVIALGVWLAHTGGPLIGSVAAVFPAAGVSTLAIVSRSRGVPYAVGLLRPMMIGGSISILVYAMAVRYTYVSIGVVAGTATAIVASAAAAYFVYRWRQHQGG